MTSASTDVPSGLRFVHSLRGHAKLIDRIAWSPDGTLIATPSEDSTIKIWDGRSGRLRHTFKHTGSVTCVAWSPDGHFVASGSGDNQVRVWSLAKGTIQNSYDGHYAAVTGVAWSPDGQWIASGSLDSTIKILTSSCGSRLHIDVRCGRIQCLGLSPDGATLAAGTDEGRIVLVETGSFQGKPLPFVGHKQGISCIVWSPDGKLLASASGDATIRLWDSTSGRQWKVLEGHSDVVTSISFSFDGRLLASKSLDGSVLLWDSKTWQTVAILPEPPEDRFWLASLAFHPRLPVLATLGEKDRIVRLWEVDVPLILGEQAEVEDIRESKTTELSSSVAAKMQEVGLRDWVGARNATLALVFTDIVGSTALGNQLGDEAMNEVLSRHFDQARVLIKNHGGRGIKTTGDGLIAAFRTVIEALDFAVELHANSGHKSVQVKVGIHVGPVQVEERDVSGATVNYTARVLAHAAGAEIWLSQVAKQHIDQVKSGAHASLHWNEHRDCALKGFEGTHTLWSV